jgi:hypothetical protein
MWLADNILKKYGIPVESQQTPAKNLVPEILIAEFEKYMKRGDERLNQQPPQHDKTSTTTVDPSTLNFPVFQPPKIRKSSQNKKNPEKKKPNPDL